MTTYHDWMSEPTVAARLARARLHHTEIEEMLSGPDVGSDGKSINRATLEAKLQRLERAIYTLENSPGAMSAGGASRIRLGRPS